jgi:hypothetical protein
VEHARIRDARGEPIEDRRRAARGVERRVVERAQVHRVHLSERRGADPRHPPARVECRRVERCACEPERDHGGDARDARIDHLDRSVCDHVGRAGSAADRARRGHEHELAPARGRHARDSVGLKCCVNSTGVPVSGRTRSVLPAVDPFVDEDRAGVEAVAVGEIRGRHEQASARDGLPRGERGQVGGAGPDRIPHSAPSAHRSSRTPRAGECTRAWRSRCAARSRRAAAAAGYAPDAHIAGVSISTPRGAASLGS